MAGKAWPEDVRPQWFNVIRRLQSVARNNNQGLAVLQITVLVDGDGVPQTWTEPTRTLLEPKRQGEQLLKLLMGDEDAVENSKKSSKVQK